MKDVSGRYFAKLKLERMTDRGSKVKKPRADFDSCTI